MKLSTVVLLVVPVAILLLLFGILNTFVKCDCNKGFEEEPSAKNLVHSSFSKGQRIKLWDVKDKNSRHWNKDAPWYRALYLDGVLQTTTKDEHKYHESLVHPAMLSHPERVERVAIIGGGDGGILREVLKYSSIEQVHIIDINRNVMRVSRKHLRQYHNCTFLSRQKYPKFFSCFDDPRVSFQYVDNIEKYFNERNSNIDGCLDKLSITSTFSSNTDEDGYDVIIINLFPREGTTSPTPTTTYSKSTLHSVVCSLRRNGLVVAQMGNSPLSVHEDFYREQHVIDKVKIDMLKTLGSFVPNKMRGGSLFVYNSYIPTTEAEQAFAVLFTSQSGSNRFTSSAAKLELFIRQRILPSALPLTYVDGAVMELYSKLPREWQDAYCMQEPRPKSCNVLSLPSMEDRQDEDASERFLGLEQSEMSTENEEENRWQLVAAVDIPKHSRLGLYDAATTIRISRDDFEDLEDYTESTKSKEYEELLNWLYRFGYTCNLHDEAYYTSAGSMMTNVNHGCDPKDWNIGSIEDVLHSEDDEGDSDDYNFVFQRHAQRYCVETFALRDIKKGEVLLQDYSGMDSWNATENKLWDQELASWCEQKERNDA